MEDWKAPKLKAKIREQRAKLKSKKSLQFVHKLLLDQVAEEFGLSRRDHEPDNSLWARIESHPAFTARREEILDRLRPLRNDYTVENQGEYSFLEELKKL